MASKPKVVICSVYPADLFAERAFGPNRGEGLHQFKLKAAPKDGFSLLEVEDCYQKVYFGESIGHKYEVIDARDIAEDLVLNWAGRMVGTESGLGPGVFVCVGDSPTKEELENARESQELYFEDLIQAAERAFRAAKYDEITDLHRKAAVWMGKEAVEWLRPIRREAQKDCPLCHVRIPLAAVVCPNCRHQIGAIPKDIAKLNAA